MSDTNSVVIEGRLTKNAEMRIAGQTNVTAFSIANNKSFKRQDGQYENKTYFFDCELWGKFGESMLKHLVKGRMLTVTGELVQDQWQDKNGNLQSRVKIKVSDMSVRFPAKAETQESTSVKSQNQQSEPVYAVHDDCQRIITGMESIPF